MYENKTALITGGTSDIAKSIVKALYDSRCNIIVTEMSERMTELKEFLESIKDPSSEAIIEAYELDLEKIEHIKKFLDQFDDMSGFDYLLNIAGINILKDFFSWKIEEWEKVLKINTTGTFFLTQAVAEKMILNNKKASIIFISSQHGIVANSQRVPYCISKGMLIQMTKALALELAPHNIRVNCVSPTFVLNERNSDLLNSAYFQVEALDNIPLKKYAVPDDITTGILFLIGEGSQMITGHNLVIDGGWTIK